MVEPENRLVARQLERAWEAALLAHQQLDEEYHRFLQQQPQALSVAEQDAIRRLAHDIPALWSAPTTTTADRKEILRQVVERVVVDAEGDSERVAVRIHWVGGHQTTATLIRPVARLDQLSYYPQLCARVRTLAAEGLAAPAIAARLNAEGYRPPKRRAHFGRQGVLDLLHRLGVSEPPPRTARPVALATEEWAVAALAQVIGMPTITLYSWIPRGWVRARRLAHPPHRWVVWADAAEIARLRERHQRPAGYYQRRCFVEDAAGSGD